MIRVTFDLDETEHKRLKVKAAQDGVSLSDVLRAGIADYLAGKVKVKTPATTKGHKPMK